MSHSCIEGWRTGGAQGNIGDDPALQWLCTSYDEALRRAGYGGKDVPYGYGALDDGSRVDARMRSLYRDALHDARTQRIPDPPSPFGDAGSEPFVAWLNEPVFPPVQPTTSRYLARLWSDRDDLRQHYERSRAALMAAIEGLTDTDMSLAAIDGWSIKDHLTHVTVWDEIRAAEIARRAADDLGADAREGFVHDLPQLGGRLAVRRVLVLGPDRFEPLHEVGRCHDLHAERPDELDGAGVHARDVRDGVQRRVLHGNSSGGPCAGPSGRCNPRPPYAGRLSRLMAQSCRHLRGSWCLR